MESDQRYYLRRASEERTAALRSVTPQAHEWHSRLAADFAGRAMATGASSPITLAKGVAMTA